MLIRNGGFELLGLQVNAKLRVSKLQLVFRLWEAACNFIPFRGSLEMFFTKEMLPHASLVQVVAKCECGPIAFRLTLSPSYVNVQLLPSPA